MGSEMAFSMVFIAASLGLGVSILIERLVNPHVPLLRPWAAWVLHIGLWLVTYSLLILLLGRPWFAAAVVSALLLTVVLVNNAKFRALREPFVFQDYEYFTDAVRHPRLYIPFLGWGKFLAAAAGFVLAVSLGLWIEAAPDQRFVWHGQLGGVVVLLLVGGLLFLAGQRKRLPVSFDPIQDLQALGLLAYLWRYAEEEGKTPVAPSPFDALLTHAKKDEYPHLVAVQSESFFDPRQLYSGIRPEVLAAFDQLKSESVAHGRLHVPAWGANTVRSEFAFLCGIGEDNLGVHRFNPYRAIVAGWNVTSLAAYLKRLGYRTVCVHPYIASFYRRDQVLPKLGFDEFIDISFFDDSQRSGPYISDAAVADKIASIIKGTKGPVFIFAITMENHGPLHLESVTESDIKELYKKPPGFHCNDLTVYLRHIRNADHMICKLRNTLKNCSTPASLCWYGDHVPIMPSVYDHVGIPKGDVEYVIWHNSEFDRPPIQPCGDEIIHDLSKKWLYSIFDL